MSEIEKVREAARLMRERAEQCGSFRGPWRFERTDNEWPTVGHLRTDDDDPHGLIADLWPSAECGEYIASIHPAVALAVAGWLDYVADTWLDTLPARAVWGDQEQALAVANAYLEGADR